MDNDHVIIKKREICVEKKRIFIIRIFAAFNNIFNIKDEYGKVIQIDKIKFKVSASLFRKGNFSKNQIIDVIRSEGRLAFILSIYSVLDHFMEFKDNTGKIKVIYQISLKCYKPFIVDIQTDPSIKNPYYSVLKYLSYPCPNRCRFCLHMNDLPDTRSKLPYQCTKNEIDIRLRYYEPDKARALFSNNTYHYYEYINHPSFFELSKKIREKTIEKLDIITSGIPLNEDIIRNLKKVEPIALYISINCVSENYRKTVLLDPHPNETLKNIKLLREYEIPFFTSIVHDEDLPLEELDKTVDFAIENGTVLIRLTLQAYSRYHPRYRSDWKQTEFYKQINDHIQELRKTVNVPIIVQPVYCFDRPEESLNKSYVVGVIPGSPADLNGVKSGDYIEFIDQYNVEDKPYLAKKYILHLNRLQTAYSITFRRNEQRFKIDFTASNFRMYPYTKINETEGNTYPFGLVLNEGISEYTLDELISAINLSKGEKVLILTSILMKPLLVYALKSYKFSKKIYYAIPKHNLWGGNIFIGDLYVADDYLKAIMDWEKKNGKPSLVILPASPFGRWGIDLAGKRPAEILAGYNVCFIRNNMIASMET